MVVCSTTVDWIYAQVSTDGRRSGTCTGMHDGFITTGDINSKIICSMYNRRGLSPGRRQIMVLLQVLRRVDERRDGPKRKLRGGGGVIRALYKQPPLAREAFIDNTLA